ncbi:MAG: hypothetical protein ACLFNS_04665 [Desulfobacterales bacterium]
MTVNPAQTVRTPSTVSVVALQLACKQKRPAVVEDVAEAVVGGREKGGLHSLSKK